MQERQAFPLEGGRCVGSWIYAQVQSTLIKTQIILTGRWKNASIFSKRNLAIQALKILIHGKKNIISILSERCNSENTILSVCEENIKC